MSMKLVRAPLFRRFISSTSRKQLGGNSHGHDEHHHVHRVFEPREYNRNFIAAGFISVTLLGIAIPTWSAGFQNRKQGFTK